MKISSHVQMHKLKTILPSTWSSRKKQYWCQAPLERKDTVAKAETPGLDITSVFK